MKDAKYYLSLPYTAVMRRDEEGDYVARIDELPGCATHGKSPKEALENLEEVKRVWIEDCLRQGDRIPEPVIEDVMPSGKWLQRVPKTLHRNLIRLAQRENVSLNQLVTSVLSEASGARKAKAAVRPAPRQTGLSRRTLKRR
jgi:antitoxin HicB